MLIRNGVQFDPNIVNVINDVQYPAGYFASNPDQRAQFDILEVDPVPPAIDTTVQIAILQGFDLVDGIWQPRWFVRDLTPTELNEIAFNIAVAKWNKALEIREMRNTANTSTFPYAGKRIAIADIDMRDILVTTGYIALFGALPASWPGGWICTDKSFIPIATVDDFKAMYQAMYDQGEANFEHSRVLLAAVDAATNLAQVAVIQW